MSGQCPPGLAWKVTRYYGVVCLLLIAVAMVHPEFLKVMPFGGLDHWENERNASDVVIDLDRVHYLQRPLHLFEDSLNIFTGLIGALIIMVPLRWIYLTLATGRKGSQEVAAGLLVLPVVVTAIVDIVQFSLALAFALAGVFAGVRYRTTLKSLSDAFFTFAAIGVGLAAGTRSLGIGLVLAIIFSYAMLLHPPIQGEQAQGDSS